MKKITSVLLLAFSFQTFAAFPSEPVENTSQTPTLIALPTSVSVALIQFFETRPEFHIEKADGFYTTEAMLACYDPQGMGDEYGTKYCVLRNVMNTFSEELHDVSPIVPLVKALTENADLFSLGMGQGWNSYGATLRCKTPLKTNSSLSSSCAVGPL